MSDLKPCPGCGNTGLPDRLPIEMCKGAANWPACLICRVCGFAVVTSQGEAECIRRWNTRAPSPADAFCSGVTGLQPGGLKRIVALAKECAEDVITDAQGRYNWPDVHPAVKHRYESAVEAAEELKGILAGLEVEEE